MGEPLAPGASWGALGLVDVWSVGLQSLFDYLLPGLRCNLLLQHTQLLPPVASPELSQRR